MQKLLPFRGGLNAYLAAPDALVSESCRECPFCEEEHRLRLHGHYERCVLLEDGGLDQVPVQRLLCARGGRTVSLLPDFCVPGRQHGAAILGTFLAGFAGGKSLLAALRTVRPDAPGHSVAQSLRGGFLARGGRIRTYLARLRPRALEPPPSAPGWPLVAVSFSTATKPTKAATSGALAKSLGGRQGNPSLTPQLLF